MTLWCRIKQSQVKALSNHFKKCFFQISAPCLLIHNSPISRIRGAENQNWVFAKNPFQFGNNARFFAAPVQENPKQERKNADEPRLNEEITAKYVRLVTDEGHDVVPRHEALQRARTLELDLVEVDREGKPPVCKLMDYHREKYLKELTKKERAKSKKSEVTLRTGAHKEVRIAVKIEQKDLQMKADAIKRLMERGYRVKCMAVGKEGEDLGGLLSRLTALIEDFSVVESGPSVERRQAFAIVRHVKFGPTKKGKVKKKIIVPPSIVSSSTQTSSHMEEDLVAEEPDVESEGDALSESEEEPPALEKNKSTWSVTSEPQLNNSPKVPPVLENRYKTAPANRVPPTREVNANAPDLRNSTRIEPRFQNQGRERPFDNSPKVPPVLENRYKTGPANRVPPTRQVNANAPDLRNSTRFEPRFQNQGRERPFDSNTSSSPSRENRHVETRANEFPNAPKSPPSSYGLFSSPKANNDPQRQSGPAEVNRYKRGPNPNPPPSNLHGNRRPFLDRGGQERPVMPHPQSSNVNPSGSNDHQYDVRR